MVCLKLCATSLQRTRMLPPSGSRTGEPRGAQRAASDVGRLLCLTQARPSGLRSCSTRTQPATWTAAKSCTPVNLLQPKTTCVRWGHPSSTACCPYWQSARATTPTTVSGSAGRLRGVRVGRMGVSCVLASTFWSSMACSTLDMRRVTSSMRALCGDAQRIWRWMPPAAHLQRSCALEDAPEGWQLVDGDQEVHVELRCGPCRCGVGLAGCAAVTLACGRRRFAVKPAENTRAALLRWPCLTWRS